MSTVNEVTRMDAQDRLKVASMKSRKHPDGTRVYSNEDIAAYTGFAIRDIVTIEPPMYGVLGRPKGAVYDGDPLPTDPRYRERAIRSSQKMLAAIARMNARG